MEAQMFCYQCQETLGNKSCSQNGVCGKEHTTSNLQDLLVHSTIILSLVLMQARKENKKVERKLNSLVTNNLFITITNANFDNDAIIKQIEHTLIEKDKVLSTLSNKESLFNTNIKIDEYIEKAEELHFFNIDNEDIKSLKSLILFGLKGLAAYLKHADMLGFYNEDIDIFLQSALGEILNRNKSVEDLLSLTMQTGKFGVDAMALLDEANTKTYGHPKVTQVNIGVRNNPAILVSGHDLKDLEMLLIQSEGSGVDIYTHSEMLPAHYYPAFKKFKHFAGNYGGAWYEQKDHFESFNGPILLTTNCLIPPKKSYKDRIYTTGAAGFKGCIHIESDENNRKDFSNIIKHAKKCQPPKELETGVITGGFAHNQTIALADKIVEAVKNGDIKKFVVMAGCDGRQKSRSYYEDFAKALPEDTVILTAGCAKYRYNKLNLGNIKGIPRVLDAGQCNDSYSLAVTAIKLQEVFNLEDINQLPIIYNIAWYEQKAVIVLLSLLYLGVKNIHLGPTLPAFLSPNVTKVLVDKFGISPISTVEEDIKLFFGKEVDKNIIKGDMLIGDILKSNKKAEQVFQEYGMQCLGCPASQAESLQDACSVHGVDTSELLKKLNS